MEILKASKTSEPSKIAGAIAKIVREGKDVEVQAIGASAVNQTIKAVAIARGFLAPVGIDLICIPSFTTLEVEGNDRTAMKIACTKR